MTTRAQIAPLIDTCSPGMTRPATAMIRRITGYTTPSALGKRVTDRDSRKGVNRTLCGKAARMRCSPPAASRVRTPPWLDPISPTAPGKRAQA